MELLRRGILIVDDDGVLREELRDVFRLAGYRAHVAPDALAALRVVSAGFKPDVMLCDTAPTVAEARELIAELRNRGFYIPTVLASGDGHPRRAAEQAGADAYIAKPFEVTDLLSVINSLLDEPSQGQAGQFDYRSRVVALTTKLQRLVRRSAA